MPHDASADYRGQIHLVGETAAVLFIGQDIPGQRQPTTRQYGHDTLLTERTDQAIEGHRGDMADDRAQFQTEAPVCGQERITGHLRSHRATAQDDVWQDREHGFAHFVHWRRQMVTPPRRTRTSWEWRVRPPPPPQGALCVS